MTIHLYEVSPRNSTVNGYPGRRFDWTKFCWDGTAVHRRPSDNPWRPIEEIKAPLPYTDNYLIKARCQYLHVPYDWAENCMIYRVRPNDSMWSGAVYRGHLINEQGVALRAGHWYWQLDLFP